MRIFMTGAALIAAAAMFPACAQANEDPAPPAAVQDAGAPKADAPLSPELQKLLDAALASGNEADVDIMARYLKMVAPGSAETVAAAVEAHRHAAEEARREVLLAQNFLDGWKGEVQLGASQSSGNSSTLSLSLGADIEKDGLHWRHKLHGRANYQRSNGLTSTNQLGFSYEPNYKFDGNFFLFGLARFESDPFQGFDARVSLSGGLGYRAIDAQDMTLDLKAGPAWRETDYVSAPDDAQLNWLTAAQYRWRMSRLLTFRQTLDSVLASGDKTLNSVTSLDSRLGKKFSTRLSYEVNFESDPPEGTRRLDTLSRVTLVYGF